jgi:hypothetical protein
LDIHDELDHRDFHGIRDGIDECDVHGDLDIVMSSIKVNKFLSKLDNFRIKQ